MLEAVKHQCPGSVQLLDQLAEGFQLAVVDLMDSAVGVVQSPVTKLKQLTGQRRCARDADLCVLDLQQQIPLHPLVLLCCFGIQGNRDHVRDAIRQLQIILSLHRDT
ncbi:hypothetical protein D3C75_1155150 [compost metagenome]